MLEKMKPTIGRIVHFEDGLYGTCAAIVANTDEKDPNGRVLLALFHKAMPTEDQKSIVYHYAEFSQEPKVGCWSWPPIPVPMASR